MPGYRLSQLAEIDLEEIGAFTIENWGKAQADRYLAEFEDWLTALAKRPNIGRRCESISPGLRRIEHASHVIFFRRDAQGILILRILHYRMLPEHHHFEAAAE